MQNSGDNAKEDSMMKRIMMLHKCKTGEHSGRQCYEIQANDGVPSRIGEHVDISNEMQFRWAEDCVSVIFRSSGCSLPNHLQRQGLYGTREVPRRYIRELLGQDPVGEDENEDSPFSACRRKVPPKPRGRTGPNPMTSAGAQAMATYTYQPPVPMPGWQGFYGPAGTQIVVMPSNALPTPVRNVFGQYSQQNGSTIPVDSEAPKLSRWLKELDNAKTKDSNDSSDSSDSENYVDYLPAMKAAGLKRVSDLVLLTSRELETTIRCSIGTAKRLQALAQQCLKDPQ
jgi:hypothetical protein